MKVCDFSLLIGFNICFAWWTGSKFQHSETEWVAWKPLVKNYHMENNQADGEAVLV